MCKGPGAGLCLVDLKYSKEASMSGEGLASGRGMGDRVRGGAKELYSRTSWEGLSRREECHTLTYILTGACWL